ncbi:unnamed protein product [Caenorhabditis angaria]|uniref:C-type lectin domain-containing protein n=1 Tax=Caenorhabditis angaria TaxID=860376 RepID=A0A9P1I930_9PELO|nr:unnamed protein product [Caenorhabditis angaria]
MIMKMLMLLMCLQFAMVDSCNVRPEGTCEVGWMKFSRKYVEWCVKFVYEKNINKTRAESICAGFGAELSSIENTDMSHEFTSAMSEYGGTGWGAWIGIADACVKLSGCGSGWYYWILLPE